MRRYETFLIIDPDISESERDPVIERVKELVTQMDGFLIFEDVWGERKLAYEIRKKKRGYYVRFDYCGSVPLVNEIERFFRIDDRALKYMTVVLDKNIDLEKAREEKAAAESKTKIETATPETPAITEPPDSVPEAAAIEKSPDEPQGAEEPATPKAVETAGEISPAEKKEEA